MQLLPGRHKTCADGCKLMSDIHGKGCRLGKRLSHVLCSGSYESNRSTRLETDLHIETEINLRNHFLCEDRFSKIIDKVSPNTYRAVASIHPYLSLPPDTRNVRHFYVCFTQTWPRLPESHAGFDRLCISPQPPSKDILRNRRA